MLYWGAIRKADPRKNQVHLVPPNFRLPWLRRRELSLWSALLEWRSRLGGDNHSLIMAIEGIQRRIDILLDEADRAVSQTNWTLALNLLSNAVPAATPGNPAAR